MPKQTRIGLIGCGGIARAHAKGIMAASNARLVALAEPNATNLAAMRDMVGDLPAWRSYQDMVKQADIDAVHICLPTGMHTGASVYCLKHGMHTLCEKPPATTCAQMRRVAKAAAASGKVYMFARQQRFKPEKLEARRRRLMAGKLGRVYHAETNWLRTRMIPFRGGWGVNMDAGGGVLLDLGVHAIDDAWFVMGCPKPVSAYAAMHTGFARLAPRNLNMPYDADDATCGMIRFEGGSSLSFTVTFALNSAGPRQKIADLAGNGLIELRVMGEEGGIDVGAGVAVSGKGKKVKQGKLTMSRKYRHPKLPFAAQAYEFCRAIQQNDEPQNSVRQAVQLMAMLNALKQSAKSGRSVAVR